MLPQDGTKSDDVFGQDSRVWLTPEEINEAPGECVVEACWIANEDCEPNRIMVACPFNPAHKMKQSKFAGHVVKCEKQYPNHNKVRCLYNTLEFIDADKIIKHQEQCPFGASFRLASLTLNPEKNTALVESHLTSWEEDPTENIAIPNMSEPQVLENDEKVEMRSHIGFQLRKAIAMENNVRTSFNHDVTSSDYQVSEDEDLEEGEKEEEEEDFISDSEKNASVSVFSAHDYFNEVMTADSNDDKESCDSDENFDQWSATSSVESDGLIGITTECEIFNDSSDEEEDNDSSSKEQLKSPEESINYDLYNTVDFSKTFSPSVNNIVLHRMNHIEDLFIGSNRPKPSIIPKVDEWNCVSDCSVISDVDKDNVCDLDEFGGTITKKTSQGTDMSDVADACGIDESNKTITEEFRPGYNTNVKQEIKNMTNYNNTDGHVPLLSDAQSSQLSNDKLVRTNGGSRVIHHEPKPRRKLSLSDLVIFPDEPEPFHVSSDDGLHTPKKLESEGKNPPWVESRFKGNQYEYASRGTGYDSSLSSESERFFSLDRSTNQSDLGREKNCTSGANSSHCDVAYNLPQGYSRGRGQILQYSNSVRNNGSSNDLFQSNSGKPHYNGYDYQNGYNYEADNNVFPPPYMSVAGNLSASFSSSCTVSQVGMGRGFPQANRNQISMGRGFLPANRDQVIMGRGFSPANRDQVNMGRGFPPANRDQVNMGKEFSPGNRDVSMGRRFSPANRDKGNMGKGFSFADRDQVNMGRGFPPAKREQVNMGKEFLPANRDQGNMGRGFSPADRDQVNMGRRFSPADRDQVNTGIRFLPADRDQVNMGRGFLPADRDQVNMGRGFSPANRGLVQAGISSTSPTHHTITKLAFHSQQGMGRGKLLKNLKEQSKMRFTQGNQIKQEHISPRAPHGVSGQSPPRGRGRGAIMREILRRMDKLSHNA